MTKIVFLAAAVLMGACGGSSGGSKWPSRPDGCNVQVFPQAPPMQTDNIGPVSSHCDETVSKDECLRTLEDQACKLGGDVVWGVDPDPKHEDGQWKYFGRAAHTK